MSELEVASQDVVRLMLQYCKENGLHRSFLALQEETQTHLNAVESVEQFVADIMHGKWDAVLTQVATLKLPPNKLVALYEQVVLELVELREIDTARSVLRKTLAMQHLKLEDTTRYLRLERLLTGSHDAHEIYERIPRDKRRAELAQSLASEVYVAPPSRLLALLGHALKWQQHQGMLPPGTEFDVFRGAAASNVEEETFPTKLDRSIKFGAKSYAECCGFSPDGQSLVTGSVDGFIEVWDPITAKLRKDLAYQKQDNFMMHETSVLCLSFSRDSDMLVTGAKDGKVKAWNLGTGQCLRRFERAHSQGVTSVRFSRDASQVLSTSFDHSVRIHGLRSGKTLKTFNGHQSYVNDAVYSPEENKVFSASSDGTVKVWDVKSTECIHTIRPPHVAGQETAILRVLVHPKLPTHLVVCPRADTLYVMSAKGEIVKQFTSAKGDKRGTDFVSCMLSPRGDWVYCVGADAHLYCFNSDSGSLVHVLKSLHERPPGGVSHHPHRNLVSSYSEDGLIKLWRAQ